MAAEPRRAALRDLQGLLSDSVARHGVVGASLAVWADGRLYEAAAGWANRAAGLEATPDMIGHYGSITKTLTATMVAKLVDDGRMELDAPIARYVPEFVPADPGLAVAVTVRHCLTHTAGLVGLVFADTGRGDDTVARQILAINPHPRYHSPGALNSYCNSGLIMLGRAIETVVGQPWHAALISQLAAPLGMDGVVARPEQALRRRYAVGHAFDAAADGWVADPHPFAMPGHAPAGSTPVGRARDLITFARMHLDRGRSDDGGYLSPAMVESMQRRWVKCPVSLHLDGWGLGWILYDWGGHRVIGHDGSTATTNAFLRIDPESGVAAALLVNCRSGLPVYEDVFSAVFAGTGGDWESGAPEVAAATGLDAHAGVYSDGLIRMQVEAGRDSLRVAISPVIATPLTKALGQTIELHPCGPRQFFADGADAMLGVRAAPSTTRLARPYAFIEADGARWLHTGQSALRRI